MTVELDKMEELRKRANISYEDAKESLEKCHGDITEALIYLEKNNKIKSVQTGEQKNGFVKKIKILIKKGNNTRFVIRKKDRTILNLSVNLSLLIAIFAFHITVLGLIVALLTGHRLRFENSNGGDIGVNHTLDKVHDNINDLKKKICEDVSDNDVQ